MATSRGGPGVRSFMASIPAKMQSVLRGAARAGANVIAEEAKQTVTSEATRDAITVVTKTEERRVVAKISVKPGWGRAVGIWLEYGTHPHVISVDSKKAGMSAGRINRKIKEGSLVINGQFVGAAIHHPGARPHPFLRVSLDMKEAEAIAAAQSYIDARVSRGGIASDTEEVDEE
jgi:hypothetical protein